MVASNGQTDRRIWSIVLAAGEGVRLSSLTQALHGRVVPKQFAALMGDRTLFQQTLDRSEIMAPPERTVVVVSEEHAALARAQASKQNQIEIVVQPSNLGTGPGLLLPLSHVLARDPAACVVVFPSDHHFDRPGAFVRATRQALAAALLSPAGVALVGAVADRPSTDLGWIQAADGAWKDDSAAAVIGFVEKPPEERALDLLRGGALWNTMITAACAASLWQLLARNLPQQAALLSAYRHHIDAPDEIAVLRRLYRDLPPADFSRDVLQKAQGLVVVPMVDAGWSDCGTPMRLMAALKGTPALHHLEERLRAAEASFSTNRALH